MMKTLGPVASCGSAAIDGVNLYYTSAYMHPPSFPLFLYVCTCTNAHMHYAYQCTCTHTWKMNVHYC